MGTYWLDAGELFYCSFRDPESSTSVCDTLVGGVCHDGWPFVSRVTPVASGEHGFGDGRERENLRGGAELDSFAGHAVDHAGSLILGDRAGAGLPHFQQAMGAIVAHAGEQNTHRIGAGGFGDGREKYVDRRALVAHAGTGLDADVVAAAALAQQHMEIAGCDQGEAAAQRVAIFGFLYVHGAEIVQAFGKGAGELRGDVPVSYT